MSRRTVRLRSVPVRMVDTALRAVGAVVSAVSDRVADVEGCCIRVDFYWRLATRQATGEELLYWAAGELGELGEMYFKNLLLAELRTRREAEDETAKLLARFREELDNEDVE